MAKTKDKKSTFKTVLAIIGNTILVFLIIIGALIAFSMLPIKNNYQVLTVMSGSMEPTIPVGSVIVVKPQPQYEAGDIITFKTPGSTKKNDFTTHRILEIKTSNGITTFVTKGDANDDSDREFIDRQDIVGKERFAVSLVGYLIGYIKTLPGLVLIIIIPAVIIVYEEIRKIHREAKDILARRKPRSGVAKKAVKTKKDKKDKIELKKTKIKKKKGKAKK